MTTTGVVRGERRVRGNGGLISVPQAADRLGLSRQTAYRMAHVGQLAGLIELDGRRLYVRKSELDRWLRGARIREERHSSGGR